MFLPTSGLSGALCRFCLFCRPWPLAVKLLGASGAATLSGQAVRSAFGRVRKDAHTSASRAGGLVASAVRLGGLFPLLRRLGLRCGWGTKRHDIRFREDSSTQNGFCSPLGIVPEFGMHQARLCWPLGGEGVAPRRSSSASVPQACAHIPAVRRENVEGISVYNLLKYHQAIVERHACVPSS